MKSVRVITASCLRAYGYRRWAAGILVGAMIGYLAAMPAQAVIDPRMETACKMPRYEGELTLMLVLEGKLMCWRFK